MCRDGVSLAIYPDKVFGLYTIRSGAADLLLYLGMISPWLGSSMLSRVVDALTCRADSWMVIPCVWSEECVPCQGVQTQRVVIKIW